jgi:hypothetical protein
LEFLCAVDGLGAARALAASAEAMDLPKKTDRLRPSDPLAIVASQHPGELLWRDPDGDEAGHVAGPHAQAWAVGADGARAVRESDVARNRDITEAARQRRRERRRGRA